MVILDTDHLSLLERLKPDCATLSARLSQIDPQEIATSIITFEEQTRGWLAYHGRSKDIDHEVAAYARLKRHLENYRSIIVLDFDDRAAAELQRLRRLRIRIRTMDLKIAAIALVHDATLLTRNLVNFRKVPKLRAEDWTARTPASTRPMNEFDRDIFKAIRGHSRRSPQDLPGILFAVDALQRTILSHEELSDGLARLIEAGKIAEAGNYRYYSPKSPPSKRSFSGVPADEYDRACKAYQAMFAAAVEELEARPPSPDDKTRQKIVVRWNLGLAFPTNSDEDAIEPLIETISRTLEADGRAEVNGCEHGQGQIDVLIFGKETDADTDDIYNMIRPIVAGFACPPGSCIIRQYEEPQREVTSDVVPGD